MDALNIEMCLLVLIIFKMIQKKLNTKLTLQKCHLQIFTIYMFIYSYIYYFRFFQILTCNSCFISNLQILLLMVSILREQNWWNLCHIFEEKKLHLWYIKPDYTPLLLLHDQGVTCVDKKSFSHNLYFWPIRKELSLLWKIC